MGINVDELEQAKSRALVDNTAQAIFRKLRELENLRPYFERRWIWELLQNAVDAAKGSKVAIAVSLLGDTEEVIFTHTGSPFEKDEIIHLIYHGSTKGMESETETHPIGRFGSGFLTTHLLAKRVRVLSLLTDGKSTSFTLDRTGDSSQELKSKIEKTWEDFKESYIKEKKEWEHSFTTEYKYGLKDENTKRIACIGIGDLEKMTPLVLAFNHSLTSIVINIEDPPRQMIWRKTEEQDIAKMQIGQNTAFLRLSRITCTELDKPERLYLVVKSENEKISVAAVITRSFNQPEAEDAFTLNQLENYPRVFVAFPLYGTEGLGFPAVVNSLGLMTTERRDGVFLGVDPTNDNEHNKHLFQQASSLLLELIRYICSKPWKNRHIIAHTFLPTKKEWLDYDWYCHLLKGFMTEASELAIVETQKGDWISLNEAYVPLSSLVPDEGDIQEINKIWEVASRLFPNRVPSKKSYLECAYIVRDWANIQNPEQPILPPQALTLRRLAERVSQYGSIEKLAEQLSLCLDEEMQSHINNEVNERDRLKEAIDWLNDFLTLILDTGELGLLDEYAVLSNQKESFRKRIELQKDGGIEESLKDILRALDSDVREKLLHKKITEQVGNLLQVMSQENVVSDAVTLVKSYFIDGTWLKMSGYKTANRNLFGWLANKKRFQDFIGYPVFTYREDEQGAPVLTVLSKDSSLLAPPDLWDERATEFFSIFPGEQVISSEYSSLSFKTPEDKNSFWKEIGENISMISDPLYNHYSPLRGDDVERLLVGTQQEFDEDQDHSVPSCLVSDIAFLRHGDRGILDIARRSKDRARQFFKFLFNYIIVEDRKWDESIEVNCECGKTHIIYPSSWLATVKGDTWVPITKNRAEKPSAESFARLFENDEVLQQKIIEEVPSIFLNRIEVGVSDIIRRIIAKDDLSMLKLDMAVATLFHTTGGNPDQLAMIASILSSHPQLINNLQEQIINIERVRKNKEIGELVEHILHVLMTELGFRVERTRVGADFVLESDFVPDYDSETEQMETCFTVVREGVVKYMIELKSTVQNYVRMSIAQARNAVEKGEYFLLCVVEHSGLSILDEDLVKTHAKFVVGVDRLLVEKVDRVEKLKEVERETELEDENVEIEVRGSKIYFKLNRRVWQNGMNLDELREWLGADENSY